MKQVVLDVNEHVEEEQGLVPLAVLVCYVHYPLSLVMFSFCVGLCSLYCVVGLFHYSSVFLCGLQTSVLAHPNHQRRRMHHQCFCSSFSFL